MVIIKSPQHQAALLWRYATRRSSTIPRKRLTARIPPFTLQNARFASLFQPFPDRSPSNTIRVLHSQPRNPPHSTSHHSGLIQRIRSLRNTISQGGDIPQDTVPLLSEVEATLEKGDKIISPPQPGSRTQPTASSLGLMSKNAIEQVHRIKGFAGRRPFTTIFLLVIAILALYQTHKNCDNTLQNSPAAAAAAKQRTKIEQAIAEQPEVIASLKREQHTLESATMKHDEREKTLDEKIAHFSTAATNMKSIGESSEVRNHISSRQQDISKDLLALNDEKAALTAQQTILTNRTTESEARLATLQHQHAIITAEQNAETAKKRTTRTASARQKSAHTLNPFKAMTFNDDDGVAEHAAGYLFCAAFALFIGAWWLADRVQDRQKEKKRRRREEDEREEEALRRRLDEASATEAMEGRGPCGRFCWGAGSASRAPPTTGCRDATARDFGPPLSPAAEKKKVGGEGSTGLCSFIWTSLLAACVLGAGVLALSYGWRWCLDRWGLRFGGGGRRRRGLVS